MKLWIVTLIAIVTMAVGLIWTDYMLSIENEKKKFALINCYETRKKNIALAEKTTKYLKHLIKMNKFLIYPHKVIAEEEKKCFARLWDDCFGYVFTVVMELKRLTEICWYIPKKSCPPRNEWQRILIKIEFVENCASYWNYKE